MYNKFRKLIICLTLFKNYSSICFDNVGIVGKTGIVLSGIGLTGGMIRGIIFYRDTCAKQYDTKDKLLYALTAPFGLIYCYKLHFAATETTTLHKATEHCFFQLFRKKKNKSIDDFVDYYFFQGGLTLTGGILILIDYILKNK